MIAVISEQKCYKITILTFKFGKFFDIDQFWYNLIAIKHGLMVKKCTKLKVIFL